MKARSHHDPPSSGLGHAADASDPTLRVAVECLRREGVWRARAHDLAGRHSWQRIQRAVEYVRLQRMDSRIANPAAYLVEVLESATDKSIEVALRKRSAIPATSRPSLPSEPAITAEQWQHQCEIQLAQARQQANIPGIREALVLLVAHHREQGELDRAIQYQQQAVCLDHAAYTLETLGELYHQARHIDEARAAYTEAMSLWRQAPGATPCVEAIRAKLRTLSSPA